MQPNIPGVISKSHHQFLAKQQQAQFAVIAVHTVLEKLLFSHLIQTDPFFNQDKQEPDWKTAVEIWNHDHADGKVIFYKVQDPINVISKISFINYTSSLLKFITLKEIQLLLQNSFSYDANTFRHLHIPKT